MYQQGCGNRCCRSQALPGVGAVGNGTSATTLSFFPFMILFVIFILRPILASLQMSFFRWEIFGPKPFIGLDNYDELLNDDLWWVALRNTVYFAFLTSALLTTIPIFIAIALNVPFRGRNVFRTLFFFPYVLSASVVGLVMRWLLGQQFGIVNLFVRHCRRWSHSLYCRFGFSHSIIERDNAVVGFRLPDADLPGRAEQYSARHL